MAQPEHPNVQVAKRLWDAAARSDVDALYRLYARDVVARTHGRNPLAGEVKGVRPVLEHAARAAEGVDDLRSELIDVYASDRGAVIHYRIAAERGASRLDDEALLLLTIVDGRIVRSEAVPLDQARNDAFWRLH